MSIDWMVVSIPGGGWRRMGRLEISGVVFTLAIWTGR